MLPPRRLRRRLTSLAVGVAAAAAAPIATAAPTEVVPGVTYERVAGGGQVTHVTRVKPSPLISFRPVPFSGSSARRGLLTSAMRQRLGSGAVAGVNGDFFNWDSGFPSGLFIQDGEFVHEPEATRSAMVVTAGGALMALQTSVQGTWQADPTPADPAPRQFGFVNANRPAERNTDDRTILYTSTFGDVTPRGADRTEAQIVLDAPGIVVPNRPISGTVHSVTQGGGSGVAPGRVVLTGVGPRLRPRLLGLTPGRRVTLNPVMPNLPGDTVAAMGGGPVLVQNGVPVMNGDPNGFRSGQVAGRSARTAVGQTAQGELILVVSEGPVEGRIGMTANEQANLMASLGSHTAIAMDSGGSSGMAIRDRLVNRVGAGERAVANGFIVSYAGVQTTEPASFISPNGDRVADRTRVVARSAKDGAANIILRNSRGKAIRLLYRGPLGPSGRVVPLDHRLRVRPGVYHVVAQLRPNDGSARTEQSRRIIVDPTLGHLRLRKAGPIAKRRLNIGFRLRSNARVIVTVRDAKARSIKLVMRNRLMRRGARTVTWDMLRYRKPLAPGVYTITVGVRTSYGAKNEVSARFRVTKPAKKPAKPRR